MSSGLATASVTRLGHPAHSYVCRLHTQSVNEVPLDQGLPHAIEQRGSG